MDENLNKKRLKLVDHYFYIEDSFIELTRIIPLDNPESTYSPRLYEILQSICSNIDGLSIIMSDALQLEPEYTTFPFIYEKLNIDGLLDMQTVDLYKLPGGKTYTPLTKTGRHNPKWWDDYNDTKHDLPEGLKAGNIGNTPVALAGLFALHVMAYYIQYSVENYLNPKYWRIVESIGINSDNREADTGVAYHGPNSKIFLPLTQYNEMMNFT